MGLRARSWFVAVLSVAMFAGQLPSLLLGTSRLADAAPTLDQTSPSGNSGGFTLGAGIGNKAAQVVTAGLTGRLTEVDLDVYCSSGAQLSIEIQGVTSGNVPDGVVKTRVLQDGAIAATGYHKFFFADPPAIAAGARFAIVVGETVNNEGMTCSINHGADGDGYTLGSGFSRSTADTSWRPLQPPEAFNDWPFKSYVTSSTTADVAINSSSVQVTGPSTLTFSVGVVNFGPDDATGAYVSHEFTGPVTITGWNQTQPGSCELLNSGLRLNCPIAPFISTGGYSNDVVVQRTGPGTITETIQVWATEADPNGTNNTANLAAPDRPDLIVTSLTAPSSIQQGSTATYTWTVKNQGTAAANAVVPPAGPPYVWGDQLWLSTSATSIAGASGAGGVIAVRSLAPGESYTQTFSATVPNVPNGNYFIVFRQTAAHRSPRAMRPTTCSLYR